MMLGILDQVQLTLKTYRVRVAVAPELVEDLGGRDRVLARKMNEDKAGDLKKVILVTQDHHTEISMRPGSGTSWVVLQSLSQAQESLKE